MEAQELRMRCIEAAVALRPLGVGSPTEEVQKTATAWFDWVFSGAAGAAGKTPPLGLPPKK